MKSLLKLKIDELKNNVDPKIKNIGNQLSLLVNVSESKQLQNFVQEKTKNATNDKLKNFALYFSNLSAVNDYGISRAIKKFKSSAEYKTNDSFKQLVDVYDIELCSGTPEHKIVESFVENFKKYEKVYENTYHTISSNHDKFKAYELLANTISVLENDQNVDLYQDVISYLNGGFELPASHVKGFVTQALIGKTYLHPILETAMEAFKALDITTQCKIGSVTNRFGFVKLTHRTTPILESKKFGKIFYANNSIFSLNNGKIKSLNNNEIDSIAKNEKDGKRFVSLCNVLTKMYINENEYSFSHKDNLYKIIFTADGYKFFINDKPKSDNKEKILESLSMNDSANSIIGMIEEILNNNDLIKILDTVNTYMPDYANCQLDAVSQPNNICIVIFDPENGIENEVIEGEPDEIIPVVKDEYDIDLADEVVNEEEDQETKEKEAVLDQYKLDLEITEENIEKINNLDDETKNQPEIIELKKQLEEEKESLISMIADLQKELEGVNEPNDNDNDNTEVIKDVIEQLSNLLNVAGTDGKEEGEVEGDPIKIGESILHPFVSYKKQGLNVNKRCFLGINTNKNKLQKLYESGIQGVNDDEGLVEILDMEEDIEQMVDTLTQQDIKSDETVADDIEKGNEVLEGKALSPKELNKILEALPFDMDMEDGDDFDYQLDGYNIKAVDKKIADKIAKELKSLNVKFKQKDTVISLENATSEAREGGVLSEIASNKQLKETAEKLAKFARTYNDKTVMSIISSMKVDDEMRVEGDISALTKALKFNDDNKTKKALAMALHGSGVGIEVGVYEKDYSEETRAEYVKKGWALPDGSFPIVDKGDLEDAIHMTQLGSDPEKAKEHVKKRAKELGAEDLIPENW